MYPSGTPDTSSSSTPSPNKRLRTAAVSWTDDLPQCQLSDVGVATNVVYLDDGRETEAYPYEDRAFNFATDSDCYLYGIFDGYDGTKAARFAADRLPAELLLGQLTTFVNDNSIKNILRQAINVVERGFFESIDNVLAQKTHLQSQLPEDIPNEILEKRFPQIAQQLRNLNDTIKGGTTAVIALVVNNSLYIANVGDSRALLCQKSKHGQLNVHQITVNHDINNKKERERLAQLGLDVERIMERGKLGMNECTRCIGDYSVKGGYKENDFLRAASSEPAIAVPDIYEPVPLSEIQSGFLVLMSDDVYKSLEQATGTKMANNDIAAMVSQELLYRNKMTGVAQNVIEKIAFLHRRAFGKTHMLSRGDITLVVRNISHPLGSCALPDVSPGMHLSFCTTRFGKIYSPFYIPEPSPSHPVSVPYGELKEIEPGNLSLKIPDSALQSQQVRFSPNERRIRNSPPASGDTPTNPASGANASASSSTAELVPRATDNLYYQPDPQEQLQPDQNGKVAPYVDFANFDEEAWLKLRAAKKHKGPK